MKAAVIIPVLNNLQFTRQLVETMVEFTPPDLLVIVDNGSTDGTKEWLTEFFPVRPVRTHIIHNEHNDGFSKAMNQGIDFATSLDCDAFVCLNNDIKIITLDWLDEIRHTLRDSPRALVGPEIIGTNEWTRQANGDCIPYMAGWLLAFSRQFVKGVGKFDELFTPAYWEDVDLSYRAARSGYGLLALPDIGLYHFSGKTGGGVLGFEKAMALCAENKRKFSEKWGVRFAHEEWARDGERGSGDRERGIEAGGRGTESCPLTPNP